VSDSRSVRTNVDGRELTLSNLEKVYFPISGFTKGQLLDYYARIAPVMLGHLSDRPLTMKRYPNGVNGSSFFAKHPPVTTPEWVRRMIVPSTAPAESDEYVVISDLPGLMWAANLGSIEFHVPLWHAGRRRILPGPPDHMVFDLDPGEGATIVDCCRVAGHIKDIVDDRQRECVAKTSGSKGLQLYVPLGGRPTWDQVRKDAHAIADRLALDHPELVVSNMRKTLRRGRVLVDWSQNHPSKTTVAAYSLRARPEPTVSTPLRWQEVTECIGQGRGDLLSFTAGDVLDRVAEFGDLFDRIGLSGSPDVRS